MAFNLMNVANIEGVQKSGNIGAGTTASAIITAPANGLIKIKTLQVWSAKNASLNGTAYAIATITISGSGGSFMMSCCPNYFYQTSDGGLTSGNNIINDLYIEAGQNLSIQAPSSQSCSYTVTCEIWT